MRKHLLVLLLAAFAVAVTPAATARTAKTVSVSITKSAFVPKDLTIQMGDTVTWKNADSANHQVTCQKCPFTSPILKPSQTYSYTFGKGGKYGIVDALHTSTKGTVTVQPPEPTVTLDVTPSTVTYRAATTVSGKVSSGDANENVVLTGRQCGTALFGNVETTKTQTEGRFSTVVVPAKNSTYRARWSTATSNRAAVKVRPRIGLVKLAAHGSRRTYRARVRAAESFADKVVVLQRWKPSRLTWVKIRSVVLKRIGTDGPTYISGRKFRARVRHHPRLRLIMRGSQAAPCYVPGTSNKIRG